MYNLYNNFNMTDSWEDWENEDFDVLVLNVPTQEQLKRLEEQKLVEESDNAIARELFNNDNEDLGLAFKPSEKEEKIANDQNKKTPMPSIKNKQAKKTDKQKENEEKQKELSNKLKEEKKRREKEQEIFGYAEYDDEYADYEDQFY